jgi:cell division protein FtsI (penicillin-binding protein 3)
VTRKGGRLGWLRSIGRRGAAPRGASAPAPDWQRTVRRRLVVAAAAAGLWAAGIETRLVFLQVLENGDLVALAERQQERTREVPPERGDILDRNGHLLATSVDANSIYAVPSELSDPEAVVDALCAALGNCERRERQTLVGRLGNRKADFAWVRRQVDPDKAKRVADLNLDGIGSVQESQRRYPNKELASHVLGYVGVDNQGLNGVEFAFDAQIRGKAGTMFVHTDARRRVFSRFERPPTSGSTVELTIDEVLQHIAERELHAGVAEQKAAGGSAIIMNPFTGEILAMASEPTFNPNVYGDFPASRRRNRAVQDLYEPGSTFKIVTAAAALDLHVMPPDRMIDASAGQIRIGGTVTHDDHNYGVLSFEDVIVRSSNVGAIKIGLQIGVERLSQYVQRFGFGRPMSPDFPAESPGIVWDAAKWTERALASVSMGYQIAVTPLQMATAVSAIANGGELMEPRIIRAIYQDGRRFEVRPKVVGRAVSPETAATLTGILENVVDRGTGVAAKIPGFEHAIAAKTGTAHKLVNGRYSNSDYNASFVGFFPSRAPAVTVIVVVDSPHAGSYYAASTAVPIFKRIAEATIRYLGIGPTVNPPAPVLVVRRDEAPGAPTVGAAAGEPVVRVVADGEPGTLPDVRGMSAREATHALSALGVAVRLSGDGFVVDQDPPAGEPIDAGLVCRLSLARSPLPEETAGQQ